MQKRRRIICGAFVWAGLALGLEEDTSHPPKSAQQFFNRARRCRYALDKSALAQSDGFPAVTGITWNALVKAHYQRMLMAGKTRMVALTACMRPC